MGSGRAEAQPGAAPEPGALVVTHFFDPGDEGPPYRATVRFAGTKLGSRQNARFPVTFSQDEVVEALPGSGPNAITTRAHNLEPGEWSVTAEVVPRLTEGASERGLHRARARQLPVAAWSWRRWQLAPGEAAPVRTRWTRLAPLAMTPGVLPGVYPLLVALAVVAVVAGQALLLSGDPSPLAGAWPIVTVVAALGGLAAAKAWYVFLNPTHSLWRGWAVDGFVVVAPLAATVVLAAMRLPAGRYLDASMPGLFLGVAIGRIGCVFAGCCSGRSTSSRWGVWMSDQRIGARRIPTQPLEAAAGLTIGVVAAGLLAGGWALPAGSVFVFAYGAYAVVRQMLLRLRSDRRASPRTIPLTAVAVAVVMVAAVVVVAWQAAGR